MCGVDDSKNAHAFCRMAHNLFYMPDADKAGTCYTMSRRCHWWQIVFTEQQHDTHNKTVSHRVQVKEKQLAHQQLVL